MKTNPLDFQQFQQEGQLFFQQLKLELTSKGIAIDALFCDHLCFRVGTMAEYDVYKAALTDHGTLLTEAQVNGRAISTFRLDLPFQSGTHTIPVVELPAPKPGTNYATGFEHAEFVIEECFATLMARFPELSFVQAGNKTLNPELCLKLDSGKQVKFHHQSLGRVIELEEAKVLDVIFDFDGTLIKSRENIYEINRIVFSEALGREVSLQESIDNFHPEFSKLFKAFAVTCPIKQEEAISSWGTVSESFSYELFEGARETLEALRNRGLRLHLWTARDEPSARRILKEHGIEDYFVTLSFADVVNSKPHPKSLQFDWQVAGRNQVLVIGDSPSDMIGAKNITAIRGAALWDPYAKRSALIETGAELFFHATADLERWLNR